MFLELRVEGRLVVGGVAGVAPDPLEDPVVSLVLSRLVELVQESKASLELTGIASQGIQNVRLFLDAR